jgi:pyruvate dehydrogenase E1 component
MPWALEAQHLLQHDWGVYADVWSVTSWTRLRREALDADHWNLLHPDQPPRVAYVTSRLQNQPGPVVAVSDWMRAVPDQIAPFISGTWSSLGTDGFGLSDTRATLRRHFHVDAHSITARVLQQLAATEKLDGSTLRTAMETYQIQRLRTGATPPTALIGEKP